MLNFFTKNLFPAPLFKGDENLSFISNQVNTIILTWFIAIAVYSSALFVFVPFRILEERSLFLGVSFSALLLIKYFLYKGFTRQSALALVVFHGIVFNVASLYSGGISSIMYGGNILFVIITAVLFGFIPAICAAIFSLLSGIVHNTLMHNNVIDFVFIMTPETILITEAVFYFCAAGIFKVTIQSIHRTAKSNKVLKERYNILFMDSPNAILLTDEFGVISLVNKAFTNVFGYSPEEMIGQKLRGLIFALDKTELFKNNIIVDYSLSKQDLLFLRKDGTYANISLIMNKLPENGFQYIIMDNTDFRKTKKAYVDSEAKWRFALDGSGFGVWDFNIISGLVNYSNQWKSMLGYDADEIGDSLEEWFNRVHPDDIGKCKKDFEKQISNQSVFFQNEHRIKSKDGSYRWMFCRGKVMERSDKGDAVRIIGTHFDISTRKYAEQNILESEIRLRSVFNSSNDALLIVDDYLISDCNESALALFETGREDIIGRDIAEFLSSNSDSPDDISDNIQGLVESVLNGSKQFFEKTISKKNGNTFIADLSLSRFEIKSSYYINVIIRDITEKKKTREAIRHSELRFRTIFNTSQYSIVISRYDDGRYLSVNPAFEMLSGYKENEVIGKNSYELGLVKDPNDNSKIAHEINKKGKFDNHKSIFYSKNGETHNVLISAAMILFENESCVLSTIVDITNLERAEQHFRQAQKMDVVGQLAGGVAHDFNNMLSGILGFAELLKMKLEGDESSCRYVDKIIETATRSSELTKKLLAFARKGKTVSTPINIHSPIKEAISILERSIDKRIKISTNLNAENSTIIGDPSLLQNAFLNLGINARDAMPNGGFLSFSTSIVFLDEDFCNENGLGSDSGFFIEIIVSDTGTGMDQEIIDKIFEPFFTTKEVGKGTGLGLAAVYGTIKEHKGIIKVFSEKGVGTIFKIYFPVDKNISEITEIEEPEIIIGKGKILFVDDESIIRNVGFSQLTNLGYEVVLAEDGQQAVEIFINQHEEISAVILDMIMPRLNGKDAFLKMKEIDPDVKVIFSSGFSHDGRMNDLMKMGAVAFLQKPYRVYELSKVLSDALN